MMELSLRKYTNDWPHNYAKLRSSYTHSLFSVIVNYHLETAGISISSLLWTVIPEIRPYQVSGLLI